MKQPAESGLSRSIRRWDLVAVTVNSVIGAGIFGLPSKVYALAGIYSLPAFLLCGLFAAMIVLCFAEVGSRFTETGGPYLYTREAFGPAAGFLVGWLMWIARITAFAANTSVMLSYLGIFWPDVTSGATHAVIVLAITLALMTVNLLGVRDVAMTTNILTAGKLAPLVLLIVVGFLHLHPGNLVSGPAAAPASFSGAMLLLVYAYTGFEIAVIPAGEIRDPRRDLPFAILTAIGVVTLLYVLIQIVCIGTLPGLAGSDRPLADAASRLMGRPGAAIIAAGVVLSMAGNLNVVMLSASRLPFAMAERAELPGFLAVVGRRFRTPHASILITAALMAALTLSGTFLYALTVSTLSRLLIYAGTCAALPVLRRRPGAPPAGFRAPAGLVAATAVLALTVWLLWNSTWRERRDTAIAAALGMAVYATYRSSNRQRSKTVADE